MTGYKLDPEVLADIRHRQASEGDSERTREAANPFGSPADPIVEHWPCRGGCGRMIGVSKSDLDLLEIANRKLVARREAPIAKAQVMWCPGCKREHDEREQLRRQQPQTEMRLDTNRGTR